MFERIARNREIKKLEHQIKMLDDLQIRTDPNNLVFVLDEKQPFVCRLYNKYFK